MVIANLRNLKNENMVYTLFYYYYSKDRESLQFSYTKRIGFHEAKNKGLALFLFSPLGGSELWPITRKGKY